jgi:XRE family aerobic/anaerobic benzoate catabolism transcriptional regulator
MSADPSGKVPPRKPNKDRQAATNPRGAIEFGARLRYFRESQGLTQEALAHGANLSAKYVSKVENGHASPSIDVAARLIEQGLTLPMSAFFARDLSDDSRADLAQMAALLGGQPLAVRRRALRVLKALCEE